MAPDPAATSTLPSDIRSQGAGRGWLLALAVLGLVFGAWPNLVMLATTGRAGYAADNDALLYFAWTRDALRSGAWTLTDAIHRPSGPMMHPWLLFVLPAKLARIVGMDLGLIWRLIGGLGMALGLYAVVRPVMTSRAKAVALAAFLLCDAGLLLGQPILFGFNTVGSLTWGDRAMIADVPRVFPHLRVPTPALPIAVLLGYLAALIRLRQKDTVPRTILAGVGFGALFHVYFYFWTAAGLALVLACLVDREGRARYFKVAVLGGLIGLPALLDGMRIKAETSSDWLLRTDKFVPIGHFSELLIPRLLIAGWLISAVFVFRMRRAPERIYPWCLTGAGLFCLNHQVVTGLQIENFHWAHAYGVAFSVLLAILVGPWMEAQADRSRGRRLGLLWGLILLLITSFALRTSETRSVESLRTQQMVNAWRAEAPMLPAGSVVAGDSDALSVAATLADLDPLFARLVEYSALATDLELDERLCLNWYLSGYSEPDARELALAPPGTWTWEAVETRDPARALLQRERRLALIDQIWADPLPWIERYRVTRIVLPRGYSPPASLPLPLKRLDAPGRTWEFWSIEP